MATIAVDFDYTLVDSPTATPLPGAREAISLLREQGHKIIVHSCNNPAYIEQWMNNHDIRFDSIWTGKGKPVADIYLDDRAIPHVNWQLSLSMITSTLAERHPHVDAHTETR